MQSPLISRHPDTLSTWWRRGNIAASILLLLLHLPRFIVAVLYFANNFADPTDYFQYDFGAYYVAAAVLNSEQQVLYSNQTAAEVAANLNMQTRYSHYVYPPFFAVLLRPLAVLPHMSAIVVWVVLNLLFLALSVRQLLLISNATLRWPAFVFAILIACLFPPVTLNLFVHGQVTLLLLWLLLLVYSNSGPFSTPRQQIIAGLSLGTAIGIKLFMAVLAPFFWLYHRRRVAYMGVATFGLTLLIGYVGAGWSNTFRYFTEVLPPLFGESSTLWGNYSLASTIQRMYTPVSHEYQFFFMQEPVTAHVSPLSDNISLGIRLGQVANLILIGAMVLTLAVDWTLRRENHLVQPDFRLSFLITTVLLVMPLSWSYTQALLLLPYVILLSRTQVPRIAYEAQLSLLLVSLGLILTQGSWLLLNLMTRQALPFWILTLGPLGVLLVWTTLCFHIWRQNWPCLQQLIA